jgi:uncharacterized Zn finger protein
MGSTLSWQIDLLLPYFIFQELKTRGMKIVCEMCGSEEWKMTIHEMNVVQGSVIYSAMKCEGCGMVYPLQELAKGIGMHVSKESVISMLKQ